jgi:uncharacterized damage-inducible protein DinB
MTATAPARPGKDEYAAYYEKYTSLVPEGDVVETLARQSQETLALLRSVPEDRAGSRYEPGKWSVKEVVGHILDAERIFAYRALRFARGDRTELPGFEQDGYIEAADFDARTLADLAEEFESVRRSTLKLFGNLSAEAWLRRGTASNSEVSVRALAHIIAGHELHHVNILKTRYLK